MELNSLRQYKVNRKCTFKQVFWFVLFGKVSKPFEERIYIFMIMILKIVGIVKNVLNVKTFTK